MVGKSLMVILMVGLVCCLECSHVTGAAEGWSATGKWELREKSSSKELEIVEIDDQQQQGQERVISYADFLSLIEGDAAFQQFFTSVFTQGPKRTLQNQLKSNAQTRQSQTRSQRARQQEEEEGGNEEQMAVMWECRPVTAQQLSSTPFTFIILPSKALTLAREKAGPFAQYMAGKNAEQYTTHFLNLEKDAILLVPLPRAPATRHTHLRSFLQTAPPAQLAEFWSQLALLTRQQLNDVSPRPVWLSTSGLGVSWLHVRISQTPTYYRHRPFISPPL